MKTTAVLLFSAGLASAFEILDRQANVSSVNVNNNNNNQDLNNQLANCLNLAGLEGELNGQDLNGLNLGSDVLNVDQLLGGSSFEDLLDQELGNVNFGSGIEELLGDMGLNGLIQEQQLEQLNQFEQLEMFLMLEQLMQLEGFGFINQNDILQLLSGSLVLGGNNLGNLNLGNELNIGGGLNGLNLGVFKRGAEVLKTEANQVLRARQQACAQAVSSPQAVASNSQSAASNSQAVASSAEGPVAAPSKND